VDEEKKFSFDFTISINALFSARPADTPFQPRFPPPTYQIESGTNLCR
jgi:hypothetical protein